MVSSGMPAPTLAYAREQIEVRAACAPPPGLAAPAKPPGTFAKPPGIFLLPPPGLNHRAPSPPNCTAELAMFSATKNCTAPLQECWNLESLNGGYEVGKLFQAAMQSHFAEVPKAMPNASCLYNEIRSDVHDLASLCAKEQVPLCAKERAPHLESTKERAPLLEITKSQSPNGSVIISIPVDSRKLHGKDKQAVTGTFELAPGVRCLMILKPRLPVDPSQKATFGKSKGKGTIELKLVESDESSTASLDVRCSFSVNEQAARGPFKMNFEEQIIHGLPKGQDEWNFWSAGGEDCERSASADHFRSGGTVVKLEVLPGSSKEQQEASTASATAAAAV